jgi:hypothetical protein
MKEREDVVSEIHLGSIGVGNLAIQPGKDE